MKKLTLHALWVGAFVIGATTGWYGQLWYSHSSQSRLVQIRENSTTFSFINPLLLVDNPQQAPEFFSLKKTLENYIASSQARGDATSISAYFREANSGKWTGVNEDITYAPSSMLKVAVMVGYLKRSDGNTNILLKRLPYTHTTDPGQHYPPEHTLSTGSYSARELIDKMITESDNDALVSLYNNDREAFVDVLKSLQIPPPAKISDTDFISPKMYSSLFRTLYSSTYLPRTFSEQALQLLSFTNFSKGLVAGVPAGTVVSHKFGEHTTMNGTAVESRQLHDCGIVYYPHHPYLLCVMTRGTDFSKLESIIANISKIVYDAVHSQIATN